MVRSNVIHLLGRTKIGKVECDSRMMSGIAWWVDKTMMVRKNMY